MRNIAMEAMGGKYLLRLETWEGDEGEVVRNVAVEVMGGKICNGCRSWTTRTLRIALNVSIARGGKPSKKMHFRFRQKHSSHNEQMA